MGATEIESLAESNKQPSVVSISYDECCSFTDTESINSLIDACNKIGKVTMNTGTTFFVASGDAGATDSGGERSGYCGVYCQNGLAACPYVTAVGGAFGNTPGEEELSTGQNDQGW